MYGCISKRGWGEEGAAAGVMFGRSMREIETEGGCDGRPLTRGLAGGVANAFLIFDLA